MRGIPSILLLLPTLSALSGCSYPVPFGDDRHPRLTALPAGAALDLGPMQCDDLPGGGAPCQTILDWSSFVYDAAAHQVLTFGGGAHSEPRTDVAVFNLRTLAWESAYPPTPCAEMVSANLDSAKGSWISTGHPLSRQPYGMLVMDDRRREMLLLNYNAPGNTGCVQVPAADQDQVVGHVGHYDPARRTWSFSAAAADMWDGEGAAAVDPQSGLTVVVSGKGLWTYDPALGVIAPRTTWSQDRMHYDAQLVYFPPNGRFYYFTRTGLVFEVLPERGQWEASVVVELTDLTGTPPDVDAKGWAYDPDQHVLAGGTRNGIFYTLDPATHRWTSEPMQAQSDAGAAIGNPSFFSLIYDPVNHVFIFTTDYSGGWRTWAYRR